ncbi:unnamed protein product [Closterium sp. Naga37s-1]|nr:unnamed protein product [Closterium sp. Naga37s-1]
MSQRACVSELRDVQECLSDIAEKCLNMAVRVRASSKVRQRHGCSAVARVHVCPRPESLLQHLPPHFSPLPPPTRMHASHACLLSSLRFGSGTGACVFLGLFFTSFFFSTITLILAAARVGYALSRDRGLPLSFLWRRVSAHKVPENAIACTSAIGYALSRDRGLLLSFLWRRVSAHKVPVNAIACTSATTLSLSFPIVSSPPSELRLVSRPRSPSRLPVAPSERPQGLHLVSGQGPASLLPVAASERPQGAGERHSVHQRHQPIPPLPYCLIHPLLHALFTPHQGYALSRDRGLPLSFVWRRVSAHKVPVNAIACTSAIAIMFLMPLLGGSVAYFAVTGMATVGWFGAYGVPVFFRIIQSDRDFSPGPFYLPNYIGHTGG